MNIQSQSAAMLDHLMWSAITAGFGIAVGVVIGIVIGVHLIGRNRSIASTSTSSTAAPTVTREVVREYIREVPAGPARPGIEYVTDFTYRHDVSAPAPVRQIDRPRPEVTR